MFAFYKIEGNTVKVGSGTPPDNSWKIYELGKEPKELLDVLDRELKEHDVKVRISEAKQYLSSTAWYVERLNDPSSGKAIPEEVVTKRAEARALINSLEIELGGK